MSLILLPPPVGTTPIGFLVPNNFVPNDTPVGILADAIDPTTGEYLSINEGFDPIDAWVLGQLALEKASGSATGNDGRDFRDVTHIGAQYEEIARQETLRTVKPLIDANVIQVVSLNLEEAEDTYEVLLTYKHTNRDLEVTTPALGRLIGAQ